MDPARPHDSNTGTRRTQSEMGGGAQGDGKT